VVGDGGGPGIFDASMAAAREEEAEARGAVVTGDGAAVVATGTAVVVGATVDAVVSGVGSVVSATSGADVVRGLVNATVCSDSCVASRSPPMIAIAAAATASALRNAPDPPMVRTVTEPAFRRNGPSGPCSLAGSAVGAHG
jgi:hypothetical protein